MLSASGFCLLSGTSLSVYGNRSPTSLAEESVPLDRRLSGTVNTHHQPDSTVLYHRAGFDAPIGLDDPRHAGAEITVAILSVLSCSRKNFGAFNV